MNPKPIALDIDGTLTDDHKRITPGTTDTLLEMQENGVQLALAFAWPALGLYEAAGQLRLAEQRRILMAYNGGKLVYTSDGQVLSEIHIDKDKAKELLRYLEELPTTVTLDDGVRFYVTDTRG